MGATWNTSPSSVNTAIKMNVVDTSSAATSKLIDLQVGGTSKFVVDKAGNMTVSGNTSVSGNSYITGFLGIGTSSLFAGTTTFINARDPVISQDGGYMGGGLYYDAGWKNTVASQGGWAVRNSGGVFTVFTGPANGAVGSTINASERIRIDGGGSVCIGTSTPTQKLTVDNGNISLRNGSPTIYFRDTDHDSAMIHNNSNLLYILRGDNDTETATPVGGQWPFYFNLTNNEAVCGGNLYSVGDVTAYYSDRRLKKNIETITDALEKVNQISGVTYKNNELAKSFGFNDDVEQIGVISQQIEKVLPQVVVPAPFDIETNAVDGTTKSKSGENYKTVKYEKIVPLLIEAIKELSAKVDSMSKEIQELKDK